MIWILGEYLGMRLCIGGVEGCVGVTFKRRIFLSGGSFEVRERDKVKVSPLDTRVHTLLL